MIEIIKNNLYSGLLITTLATISLSTQEKAIANEVKDIVSTSSSQTSTFSFSTQAKDLLDRDANNFEIAREIRDLEQFCQNYPYNSRCDEITAPDSQKVDSDSSSEESTNDTEVSQGSPWGATFDVGTLGIGGSVARRITPNLNARLGVNAFGLGVDIEDTDVSYESDLDLLNISTLLDYHIIRNSAFRVTAGLIFNGNEITGTATGNGTITIGDETFTSGENGELESVDAEVDIHNDVAPYLGIGFGNPTGGKPGLGFWFNAGVMFGGSPDITISPNFGSTVDPTVRAEIEQAAAREEAELEDEIDWLNIYPVISLGINYHF